jgi:hypothetical protein
MTKSQLAKCLATKCKFEEMPVNQNVCRPNVFRPKDRKLELCLKGGNLLLSIHVRTSIVVDKIAGTAIWFAAITFDQ